MKLVQIFANKNFKAVRFSPEFNVVLATITDKQAKKDTHNLGKTSLIHVINFLLLGKFNRKNDKLFRDSLFDDVVLYCEIQLNSGKHLMIRRSIDQPTKIGFSLSEQTFPPNRIPHYEMEELTFEKAKAALNAHLSFDILLDYDYRKSITYFLRTQQDFLDVYKLNKFTSGPHIDWKPFIFDLLGFEGKLIFKKLEMEKEIATEKAKIEVLLKESSVKKQDRDRIVSLIDVKQQELLETESTIDKFNFFKQDQDKHRDLIDRVDAELQAANSDRYRIGYEIGKVEEALQQAEGEVGVNDLRDLFHEVELHFPDSLSKQFEDLMAFNKAISTERRKYLAENLMLLRSELHESNRSIAELEHEKEELLSFLTEKDSYSKFKAYQKQLARLASEVDRLQDKLSVIDRTTEIETRMHTLQQGVEEAVQQIGHAITLRKHADINRTFNGIIQDILGTNALISINQNAYGNVEFEADYLSPADLLATSEAQGTTYKKILCMAFDLSLLIHYSSKSFFRFVYHDGILEGLDDRIKLRLLSKVKAICQEYNIQYILSLIDSDLPLMPDGTRYAFAPEEICLKLNDKDDSGRLFLHSF